MNQELKVYLFSKPGSGLVSVSVFRSMDMAVERWEELRNADDLVSGLIFVGRTRPSSDEVDRILSWPSFILVSESARWLLLSSFTVLPTAVESLLGTANYPDMSVYLGCQGWGYEPELARRKLVEVRPAPAPASPAPSALPRPTLFDSGDVSASDDPFVVAKHLPEWALEASIYDLPLTVRCRNVVEDQGFQTLSDLTLWSAETAKSWKNFGRQSMRDLAEAIKRFVAFGPGQLASREALPVSMDLPPLLTCIDSALLRLNPKESAVLRSRWGYDTARETLECIASEMSVTRERIRQIEVKATRRLADNNLWVNSIAERVRILLKKRTQPLYLHFLEVEDTWFAGFAERAGLLGSLFDAFDGDDCHVIAVNRSAIVSYTSQDDWDTARSAIIETLKQRQGDRLERPTVRVLVEAMLPRSPELTSEMMDDIKDQLNFVEQQGSEVLVSVGKKVITAVTSILDEAIEPLHYSEVWRLCESRLGRSVQRTYVHNTLMSIDALYFDRGTYGTWKHFPLDATQQALIVDAIDEIVNENEISKQWHTEELLKLLMSDYEWLGQNLTRHLLDLLLRRTTTLKPVGRMVWIPRKSDVSVSSERIDVANACARILADSGRPMKAGEIRSILEGSRGLGRNFQMHSTAEITRTAPGLWGLVRRDFGLDGSQYRKLIDAAVAITSASGEMIETDDMVRILREQSLVPSSLSPFAVVSLLQTDRVLHVFRGQMIGLAEWASTEEQENDALIELEEATSEPLQPTS